MKCPHCDGFVVLRKDHVLGEVVRQLRCLQCARVIDPKTGEVVVLPLGQETDPAPPPDLPTCRVCGKQLKTPGAIHCLKHNNQDIGKIRRIRATKRANRLLARTSV